MFFKEKTADQKAEYKFPMPGTQHFTFVFEVNPLKLSLYLGEEGSDL